MYKQEIVKSRKQATSVILTVTGFVDVGKKYMVREVRGATGEETPSLVITEDKTAENLKTIREFRNINGKIVMRKKNVIPRDQGSSTVLSLSGFIEEGKYYVVTEVGDAVVIKPYLPEPVENPMDEVQEIEETIVNNS